MSQSSGDRRRLGDPGRWPDQALPGARRPSTMSPSRSPPGSVFGLLGENGAGKSTTIKSPARAWSPPTRAGSRRSGSTRAWAGLEVRRKVGYVPEQPGLYEWMTVAEIGWFAAGFHPGARAARTGYQSALPGGLTRRVRPARRPEDQGAVQGDAGQGRAGPGPGVGARAAGPRRADLGPGRPGPPRVPGEHGRPGRRGADGPALQPPDRRGRAGGQPRGPDPPGEARPGRAARRAEGPDLRDDLPARRSTSRLPPPPMGSGAGAGRRRRRPSAGPLAGPLRRPVGPRGGARSWPGVAGDRDRDPQPRKTSTSPTCDAGRPPDGPRRSALA